MLEGRRIAILVEKDFEDIELAESIRVMKETGSRVVIVSNLGLEIYAGRRGVLTVHSDVSVNEVNAGIFDAVIIPGGSAINEMCTMPGIISFLWVINKAGKLIAAISEGPRLLRSANVLKGRRVTSPAELAEELEKAGAVWLDEPVVRDGNLVTARKTSDLPRFNKKIVEILNRKNS